MIPNSIPTAAEYLFTDDGRMVIGDLDSWAKRWVCKPGRGHRGMSHYLLSWNGDSVLPGLHYIKITRRKGVVRITANGVDDVVHLTEETP